MIIGVDIGGTKTLIGLFDLEKNLIKEVRFDTTRNQLEFENNLSRALVAFEVSEEIKAVVIASPGRVEDGVIIWAGPNLGWKDFSLSNIIKKITDAPLLIDNDANLAALGEARSLTKNEQLVLYITLSTGVGSGVVIKGKLDPSLSGTEAGQMMIYNELGQLMKWEDIASGKALTTRTGQRAESINDETVWRQYAKDVCLGLQPTINVLRPQKVILGGGVGMHADKFKKYLQPLLREQINSSSYEAPEILPAHYGEKSVIYGCYEYAKDYLAART